LITRFNDVGGTNTCTIGANARHNNGAWYYLTAAHCSDQVGVIDFERHYQPTTNFSIMGDEFSEEAWFFQGCPYAPRCKKADVAIYQYFGRSPDLRVARAQQNSINLDFPDSWQQQGLYGSRKAVGTPLTFVGAFSGRRTGTITVRCADIYWSSDNGWYRCIDGASFFAQPGDSGGPVLFSPGDPSVMGIYGILKGQAQFQAGGTVQRIYTPAINVRNALPFTASVELKWCFTLQC
jgi:hypothetical protein